MSYFLIVMLNVVMLSVVAPCEVLHMGKLQGATTFSKMTPKIMIFSIMRLSITTFSISINELGHSAL